MTTISAPTSQVVTRRKIRKVLESPRTYATILAVLIPIAAAYVPHFPLTPQDVTLIVFGLASYVIGTSIRPLS